MGVHARKEQCILSAHCTTEERRGLRALPAGAAPQRCSQRQLPPRAPTHVRYHCHRHRGWLCAARGPQPQELTSEYSARLPCCTADTRPGSADKSTVPD
jgi:hypothetical protein